MLEPPERPLTLDLPPLELATPLLRRPSMARQTATAAAAQLQLPPSSSLPAQSSPLVSTDKLHRLSTAMLCIRLCLPPPPPIVPDVLLFAGALVASYAVEQVSCKRTGFTLNKPFSC